MQLKLLRTCQSSLLLFLVLLLVLRQSESDHVKKKKEINAVSVWTSIHSQSCFVSLSDSSSDLHGRDKMVMALSVDLRLEASLAVRLRCFASIIVHLKRRSHTHTHTKRVTHTLSQVCVSLILCTELSRCRPFIYEFIPPPTLFSSQSTPPTPHSHTNTHTHLAARSSYSWYSEPCTKHTLTDAEQKHTPTERRRKKRSGRKRSSSPALFIHWLTLATITHMSFAYFPLYCVRLFTLSHVREV